MSQSLCPQRILIIRFSSLGDIVQCLEAASALKRKFPHCEIHWLVRSDFADFLETFPDVDKLWILHRKTGFLGLIKLIASLHQQSFTHIYDAHSNLRSHIVSGLLVPPWNLIKHQPISFVRRSKERFKRWLLFSWRINRFPAPYIGAASFLRPMEPWGISLKTEAHQLNLPETDFIKRHKNHIAQSIVLAPSAAWELKRWPVDNWKLLIKELPKAMFTLLGGPKDQFCDDIAQVAPDRVVNLAGKISWLESAACISWAKAVVSGDTGLLHMADLMGRPTIALIGPTAFGYPARSTSKVLEISLSCKPCTKDGRGKCTNSTFKKCMIELTPQQVGQEVARLTE